MKNNLYPYWLFFFLCVCYLPIHISLAHLLDIKVIKLLSTTRGATSPPPQSSWHCSSLDALHLKNCLAHSKHSVNMLSTNRINLFQLYDVFANYRLFYAVIQTISAFMDSAFTVMLRTAHPISRLKKCVPIFLNWSFSAFTFFLRLYF